MDSALVTVTIQAAFVSGLSNALAQALTAYRHQSLSLIDPVPFVHFVLFSILSTPLNYLWQRYLEDTFPSTSPAEVKGGKIVDGNEKKNGASDAERLNVTNTAVKFLIDQSLGSAVNTVLFIGVVGMFRGMTLAQAILAIRQSTWPMMVSGYKVWPLVTLFNLTVVPPDHRMLVGSVVGLIWGVYMNLIGI